ncbi:hypothetical protein OAN15_01325 [bacterium]|nr:hypothetical protein [bacterium]
MSSAATLANDRLLVLHELGHACVAALCGYETQIAPETELGTGVWDSETGETLAARPLRADRDFPILAFAFGGGVAQKAFECPHLTPSRIVNDALKTPASLRGFASDQDLWMIEIGGVLARASMPLRHRSALVTTAMMVRCGSLDPLIDLATARLLKTGSCVVRPKSFAA